MTDKDITTMITELYNKLIKVPKPEKKPRKVSMREYFILSYVKESLYRDMTPFELTRGTIDEVANLIAQMTYKLLIDEEKESVKQDYEAMTNSQLEDLRKV